jgi:2-polyprenyl-3-methyl-5-hydroxy-6-metoxy-1,4-benzoquinol methylase
MNCKACGSDLSIVSSNYDHEYSTMNRKIYNFFECDFCGFLMIDPMEVSNLGDIYPSTYYSYSPEGHNWLYDAKFKIDQVKYHKILKRFGLRDLRVMDIGGGTGQQLTVLLRAYKGISSRSLVIDLDPNSEEFANANGHDFVTSRFEEYEPTEKSDVILALNILEHVASPSLFLNGIKSNLSSDGVAVIQTPNYKALDYKYFRKTYWGGFHTPRHFYIFNHKSIVKLVESSGLKVETQKFIPAGPFWAFSIISWFRIKFRVKNSEPLYKSSFFIPLVLFFSAFDFFRSLFNVKTSQQWLVVSLNEDSERDQI